METNNSNVAIKHLWDLTLYFAINVNMALKYNGSVYFNMIINACMFASGCDEEVQIGFFLLPQTTRKLDNIRNTYF